MAFFVTPGIAALRPITSLNSSNALPLSRLRPPIPSPLAQCLATACLRSPYSLPIWVKFGLMPSWRYMLGSPMTFLPNRAPPNGFAVGGKLVSSSAIGEGTVAPLSKMQ